MRTRTAAWIALAFAGLSLFGCNGDSTETASKGPSPTTGEKKLVVGIVYDSGGIGDKSFNDSANRGIERAKSELGIEARAIESKANKDFETNLTALAEEKCDLVIAVGIMQQKPLEKVAEQFPGVKFAIVDGAVPGSNVRGMIFAEHEGSFLAGYLAAMTTKSKTLGFVGGMDIPLIQKFYAGYVAGAHMADPKVKVLAPKYTGSWDNSDLGKQAANALFADGADIVYHAAGRAGLGVLAAAKDQNKLAIGVDSDQDGVQEGFVLTSMIKRVDEAVFQSIKDLKEGKFDPGTQIYDLKSNGVGLSEMKYTKDKVSPETLKKLDEIKADIISGKIKVPEGLDELTTFLNTPR